MQDDLENISLKEFSLLDVYNAFKKYSYLFYILVPSGFIIAFITSSLLTPLYSSDILIANNSESI